jgi:hypothetical protein
LIFVSQLAACRKSTAKDLIGAWQVDYGTSKLTLKLNADGTFEQLFQKEGEQNIVHRTGRWEMTDFEGPSVLLTGPLFVQDQTGAIDSKLSAAKDAGWVLHINQTFGNLTLTVSDDLGLYFEKRH